MFIIMSGAYIGQELQTEFGRLPPSFLPLGNRRLFHYQVKLAPLGMEVYLTLPESFLVSKTDAEFLKNQKVKVLRIPDNLELGESLICALNSSNHDYDEPLHILFGDTLFRSLPEGENFASLSLVENNYHWAVVNDNSIDWLHISDGKLPTGNFKVLNGYFNLNQPRKLLRALAKTKWNFLESLSLYRDETNFKTSLIDDWLDFGHVNTYYSSKATFTTQRAFNSLNISDTYVEKTSKKITKMLAEANWFEKIPYELRLRTPQFLGKMDDKDSVGYRIEYLRLSALNELYVFAELPDGIWFRIINECFAFLKECQSFPAPPSATVSSFSELFTDKTFRRLSVFCDERVLELSQKWTYNNRHVSLDEIVTISANYLPTENTSYSVLHGDFCFSNILYDFRSNRIKTIDPRGLTVNDEVSIYGHIFYDIAKLGHSIIGLYDWIIAGYFKVSIIDFTINFTVDTIGENKLVQDYFYDKVASEFNLSKSNVIAMQIHLFLSMLPLHSDNPSRQDALFANAFRLYDILVELN